MRVELRLQGLELGVARQHLHLERPALGVARVGRGEHQVVHQSREREDQDAELPAEHSAHVGCSRVS